MQFFRNLGVVRLAVLGGVAVALIAFLFFLTSRLASPSMQLLYSGLEPGDSREVVNYLSQNGARFELRGQNGSEIYVSGDQINSLRMSLAQQGLPTEGSMGYEIFDKSDGFGTTNFVLNINQLRALEGELARTVSSIRGVRSARVHLVMPRRELFSRERMEPSASIALRMQGAQRLDREQIKAIQYLVGAAVPGLTPTKVSIIDDKGSLLARGVDDPNDPSHLSATAEERRIAYESRTARAIEMLLERTVGFGKVRAEVSAELDFDRIVTNKEEYDPDGQVVRSTQTVDENRESNENAADQAVTVQTNLPEAQQGQPGGGSTSRDTRTEETVNYEITRTVQNIVRETGNVRRLTVAVLVDGTYARGDAGDAVYQERDPQQLEQIETLVRSAIGFDANRGDQIEVVNMRFAPLDDIGAGSESTLFGLSKNDFLQLAEIIVLAVVGLLVILLVVRPVLSRLFESLPAAGAILSGPAGMLRDQSGAAAALTGPGMPGMEMAPEGMGALALPEEEEEDMLDTMIDISRVEGRVRASSLRKIGEIVDKHPDEAVSIIRNWMYQEQS
jgi:flagellar M-ring protein FliF